MASVGNRPGRDGEAVQSRQPFWSGLGICYPPSLGNAAFHDSFIQYRIPMDTARSLL